jgi:hypothetical protein
VSIRVHIVTEGQTESDFVNKVLTPYFSGRNITLIPCTLVTKMTKKQAGSIRAAFPTIRRQRTT